MGSGDMTKSSVLKLGKVEAAQRQLRTAITLWFTGGDPVSIHALAFSAYEVLHAVSKKRNKYRPDLLFDTDYIKDEYRSDWNIHLKKEAYFFKHADRDPDAEIEFNPEVSWGFLVYATLARELCGQSPSSEESAFFWWLRLHKPNFLTEQGRKALANDIPIEVLNHVRSIPKDQFLHVWNEARRGAILEGRKIGILRIGAR
jgi:hypothetical protein